MQPITITINGEAHSLRLLHQDLALAEFKSGLRLMGPDSEDFWDLAKAMSYKLSVILWAAMIHENENLALDTVRGWINYQNAAELQVAAASVMNRDMAPVLAPSDPMDEREPSEDPFAETTGSAPDASLATT